MGRVVRNLQGVSIAHAVDAKISFRIYKSEK